MNWQEANKLIEELNKQGYCGYSDWRLPSFNEFSGPTDCFRFGLAMSQEHPFDNVQPNWYWSSTTYAYNKDYAWVVRVYDGLVGNHNKSDHNCVWPVRSGRPNELDGLTRFVDNGDGTVTDKNTGLMWTKDANEKLVKELKDAKD